MVRDGWVYCPICNNKTRTKIRPDTVARNLPVFCPKCKNTMIMQIANGNAEMAGPLLPLPELFNNMKRKMI